MSCSMRLQHLSENTGGVLEGLGKHNSVVGAEPRKIQIYHTLPVTHEQTQNKQTHELRMTDS